MAEPIILNNEQQSLYDELKELVAQTQAYYSSHSSDYETQEERYRTMAEKAHALHMSLKAVGHEPKHHAYMYENREVPVEDIEFYNHLHPVEDLLAFIDDPDANNDPEDTTIGEVFKVRIYTNRWGRYDSYRFKRTDSGWIITGGAAFNQSENLSDKSGKPSLYKALDHDTVCYPQQTGDVLCVIWEEGKNGASKEELQMHLDDLGEWISSCEKSRPEISWRL